MPTDTAQPIPYEDKGPYAGLSSEQYAGHTPRPVLPFNDHSGYVLDKAPDGTQVYVWHPYIERPLRTLTTLRNR